MMRAQLEAVIDELKTLRAEGVSSVYLEEQTIADLKAKAGTVEAVAPSTAPAPVAKVSTLPSPPENQPNLLASWKSESDVPEKPKAATKPAVKKDANIPDWIKPIPAPTAFDIPEGDKQTQWNWLRDKIFNDPICREHVRLEKGKKVVFGVGNLDADVFFCGEAPGADEEIQGEPFVGKAGQLLDKIIAATGLKRDLVMIGNIMNWRPEHDKPYGNRPPTETEIAYCLPHLEAQVEIVKPKVIVALGATAAHGLLGYDPERTVGRTRGKWMEFKGIPLILTYHPSYLLRNNTNRSKRMVWEDMLLVMDKIGLEISEKQRGYFAEK
ncbi:uracil-DNA glycosylase [Rubellicoccus peritrichatus]|uniref:Type-4 uracil-DNA glycosylase n=1 Tax=Rubellicoccus peritrichatus TaxID=3080537 RepID=A0AAQ3QX40_9BACT|nr:uracil-DNA glycosylase [Puniceicoccus sp. CR14]WOO42617.1 uracil-DNA glycosylase [Puniceicoccus sp. CR14]